MTLALLLLVSKPQASRRTEWLYPGGAARYRLHQKKKRMSWGEWVDPGLLARQKWCEARNRAHGGKK